MVNEDILFQLKSRPKPPRNKNKLNAATNKTMFGNVVNSWPNKQEATKTVRQIADFENYI